MIIKSDPVDLGLPPVGGRNARVKRSLIKTPCGPMFYMYYSLDSRPLSIEKDPLVRGAGIEATCKTEFTLAPLSLYTTNIA